MSATLYMRRSLLALRPIDPASEEVLEHIPEREDVRVEVYRPRNIKHHRKFFALLKAIFPHQTIYPTMTTLRAAIEVALGYGESVKLSDGRTIIIPKSISFSKLDQAGFEELYDRAVELIVTRILPSVGSDDLNREVAEIMAGREADRLLLPSPQPASSGGEMKKTTIPAKQPLAGVHDETIYHVLNKRRGQSWFDACNALEAALVEAGWTPPPGHPLAKEPAA